MHSCVVWRTRLDSCVISILAQFALKLMCRPVVILISYGSMSSSKVLSICISTNLVHLATGFPDADKLFWVLLLMYYICCESLCCEARIILMLEIVLLLFQIGINNVHIISCLMRYNATTFIRHWNGLALSLWASCSFKNCLSVFSVLFSS